MAISVLTIRIARGTVPGMHPVIPRFLSLAAAAAGGAGLMYGLRPEASPGGQTATTTTADTPVALVAAAAAEAGTPFPGSVAGLLELAKKAPGPEAATAAVMNALARVPVADLARLAREFPWRQNSLWQEDTVSGCIMARWLEKDAEAASQWVADPDSPASAKRYSILCSVARHDPARALRWAKALQPPSQRPHLVHSIAGVIAESDPHQALSVARSSGYYRPFYRTYEVFRIWAMKDAAAAFAAARAASNADERKYVLPYVLGIWMESDPAAARAALAALPQAEAKNAEHNMLQTLAQKDPAGAFAAATELTGSRRTQAMDSVLWIWVGKDPQGALSKVCSLPRKDRVKGISTVFNTWASNDPTGAAAAAASMPELTKAERRNAISQIASQWAGSDAAAALQWARSLNPKEGGNSAVSSAIQSLAHQDGPAAAAAWAGLSRQQQTGMLSSIAGGWARHDEAAATAWAQGLPNPRDRAEAVTGLLYGADLANPERITSLLAQLPTGPARSGAISYMVQNRSDDDPAAMLKWLGTLPEGDRFAALKNEHGSSFTYYLSQEDPDAFAALLASTPGAASGSGSLSSLASEFALRDPASALEWTGTLETSGQRRDAANQILQTWAYENPQEALAKARAFPDAEEQKAAVNTVLQTWAQNDPDAALAWAATATGEEKDLVQLQGSLARADSEPSESASMVSALLSRSGAEVPAHLANAAASVASSWFRQDTAAASQWAAALPEGPAREQAVQSIASSWTNADPMAASEWVTQLPAGKSRDLAAGTLSRSISRTDPESALAWAASIQDTSRRDDAVRDTIYQWHYQDRKAAQAALLQAPLSESIRASLLEEFAKPAG